MKGDFSPPTVAKCLLIVGTVGFLYNFVKSPPSNVKCVIWQSANNFRHITATLWTWVSIKHDFSRQTNIEEDRGGQVAALACFLFYGKKDLKKAMDVVMVEKVELAWNVFNYTQHLVGDASLWARSHWLLWVSVWAYYQDYWEPIRDRGDSHSIVALRLFSKPLTLQVYLGR